eukprot:TRINITY_DN6590_c1_g7_i1.p1 TRINITY_DN6590_c1_g7~~TRINITY_DN6590_c1_g7_i1.p1  ORF type:complete len:3710 (+),score=739.71 TRINITY_DN6590_c1_g7_i1:1163-11131(+)
MTSMNSEDCVAMRGDGTWHDEFCTTVRKYVCERPGDFTGVVPGDEFRFGGYRVSQDNLVQPSSAGGTYRMCWCAYSFQCSAAEDFRTDFGALTFVGPAPLNQHKTCVSGQPCVIRGVEGQHLQDGDQAHILDTCGQYVVASNYAHYSALGTDDGKHLPRFPTNGRQSLSLAASGAGADFSWGTTPISAMGGQYRLCWCAEGFSCSVALEFRVDFARFDLVGPAPLVQSRTCVSGQPCAFQGLEGLHLASGDRVAILDTCGRVDLAVHLTVHGMSDGISNPAFAGGSSYQWGGVDEIAYSGQGGQYRLCWVAAGFSQNRTSDFRVDFGALRYAGPAPLQQNRTCISGQLCDWNGFTGVDLMDGDKIMILDACGVFRIPQYNYEHPEDIVPRLPMAGRSLASEGSGSSFSWGDAAAGAYMTAEGGVYRLCWCSSLFTCSGPEHFRADAGALTLVGPAPLYQTRTCVAGQACEWGGLSGFHLMDGDAIAVLDTCGLGLALPSRWPAPETPPGLSRSMPSTLDGTHFSWGVVAVSAAGGLYRLCWCASPHAPSASCSVAADFRTDAGTLQVVGPWPLFQGRTCVAGQVCTFGNFIGSFLQDGDRIMILDTCANHEFDAISAVVPRFADGGLSLPAEAQGSRFPWAQGLGASVSSAGGIYRMCWCAAGFDCELTQFFQVDAGHMTIIGPNPQFQHRTCVSGQVCVTAGITGQDLGDGDRIMILDTCGYFTAPQRFSGGAISDPMTMNGEHAHWGGYEDCDEPWNFDCRGVRPTSRGGDYRLCWCAHNYTCDQPSDYRVDVGLLTFVGPNPLTNTRTCVAGQPCAFQGIGGHFLQDGDKIMILDTCGRPEHRQLILRSDRYGITVDQLMNQPQYGFFDGQSMPATATGSSFVWADGVSVITAPGGLYRLCWCGATYDCEIPEDFQTDAGQHEVVGPFFLLPDWTGTKTGMERLQTFTCTTNEPCSIKDLQGRYLSNGDLVMVKRWSCRPDWEWNTSVTLWPSRTNLWGISDVAKETTVVDDVSSQDYAWAVDGTTSYREVRAEGAYYRLCWCASGYSCNVPKDFVVDAGTMILNGPHFGQHRTCLSGTACEVKDLTGVGLSDGDRTLVARFCDADLYVARFSNNGFSDPAVDSGTTLTWADGGAVPITSPGGFYHMCWCGSTQPCAKNGRNYRVDYGTFYILGPAPLTQSRTCISGELCEVDSVTGYGLQDGDQLMMLSKCGDPLKVVDRWPDSGISLDANTSGSTGVVDTESFEWGTYVTSGGGTYWMCWCASALACDRAEMFNVEAGLLTLIGPYLGIDRTCKSGLQCGFGGVQGLALQDGDQLMIQNQCGSQGIVHGWPDDGVSDPAIFGGTEYSWGSNAGGLHVTSAGGEYSMCWCSAKAPSCSLGDFRTELGILKLIGPATGQKKECTSGQACIISGFGGYELVDGDRILISDSCLPAVSAYVPGFYDSGIFLGTGGGSIFANDGLITAGGGIYAMCWCPYGAPCQAPSNFQVDAGSLTVVGPHLNQHKTCLASQVCTLNGYSGQSLSTNDRILILDTCGTLTPLDRMPNGALATKLEAFGTIVSWGPARATAAGGTYRMCWCAASGDCKDGGMDFIVDSGMLHMIGPRHYQTQECVPGTLCTFEDFQGYGLQDGDRIMALGDCGSGTGVHGFPNNAITNGATKDGMRFGWGDGSSNRNFMSLSTDTTGGVFRLCWCPGAVEACAAAADFRVDAGAFYVRGPHAQKDTLCAAGQSCTLGPWDGTMLAQSDAVSLVRFENKCMTADSDSLVAFGAYKTVLCNLAVTKCEALISGVETQHGGRWRICYCVGYTDVNGQDNKACTEMTEFTAWAGVLEIRGPTGAQEFPCAVGVSCSIGVNGFLLDSKDKVKLVKQADPCNSFPALGVEAQEQLIRAGVAGAGTNTISPLPDMSNSSKKYALGKIAANGDYKICYCSSVLPCINPFDFGGVAGSVQVSGADSDKVYVCRRGSPCTIMLEGWRMGPNDKLKIISEGGNCATDPPTMGFANNPAEIVGGATFYTDATKTRSINEFFVGIALIGTQEQGCATNDVACGNTLCYCPGIGGCDEDHEYTHSAGALRVTESIRGISIDSSFPLTSFSIGILVECAYPGGIIRCAAKPGPATDWGLYPDSSFFATGPSSTDVAWGASAGTSKAGANKVTLHLTKFVNPGTELRTWCYLSDTTTYVYPPDLNGVTISVPQGMMVPSVTYNPRRAWHGSLFRVTIDKLLISAARRRLEEDESDESEASIDQPTNATYADNQEARRLAVADIRVMTVLSTETCDSVAYHMENRAVNMLSTMDKFGNMKLHSESLSRLSTILCMDAPDCVLLTCFFGGPQEYPIAMNEHLALQTKPPSLVTTTIFRGAPSVLNLLKEEEPGYVSWVSKSELLSRGIDPDQENGPPLCPDLQDAKDGERWVPVSALGESDSFLLDEPVGEYLLCLMDNALDDVPSAPLNVIGSMALREVIANMVQSEQASSRTTLRIDVAALLPGTVTCAVKTMAATMRKAPELSSITVGDDMSEAAKREVQLKRRTMIRDFLTNPEEGTLALSSTEVPAALPPFVTVVLVLSRFPETDEIPAWCWHSSTEELKLTTPDGAVGKNFELPGSNPTAHLLPTFVWPGAHFLVRMENVHDVRQSRVHLANASEDCAGVTYEASAPVAQLSGLNGQELDPEALPIPAYLVADGNLRKVCFFELPNSMALSIDASMGANIMFPQSKLPSVSLIVDGAVNFYIHRGQTINIMMQDVHGGEDGQIFIIKDSVYEENGGHCLPEMSDVPSGDLVEAMQGAESTASYVERVATVAVRDVVLLPTPMGSTTHYVTINEVDTTNFEIGVSYTVCYTWSSKERKRIFNKIGDSLPVRDVIVEVERMAAPPGEDTRTTSEQVELRVLSSLRGTLSCMACVRHLERPPRQSEIRGDYATAEEEDFVPAFKEEEILGRALEVPVADTNVNTTVTLAMAPEKVPNIVPKPMGVPPEVFAWCFHSTSAIIYPNAGEGVVVALAVYPPPVFRYATPEGEAFTSVVLAREVSFPPLQAVWATLGFPRYYYDNVVFTITPTLPAGLNLATNGQLEPDPLPEQLSPVPSEYEITALSMFDESKSASTKLTISVQEPATCELQSIKSTEAVTSCTVHDTDNMYVQAVYLLISRGADIAFEVSSFSACYGDATPVAAQGDANLNFVCTGDAEADSCCCWVWIPGGSDLTSRDVTTTSSFIGRVQASECNLLQSTKYDVMTMAAGVNPLDAENPPAVVWPRLFEFTVPQPPPDRPIQFRMRVNMVYEDECDPVRWGPEKEKACRDTMQQELVELLGAPPDMIEVTKVEPASD